MNKGMGSYNLTNDEKSCLRRWFKQAIVQLEMEEAKEALLRETQSCNPNAGLHLKVSGRRIKRSRLPQIVKQLA